MQLDELQQQWAMDSDINENDLSLELIKIPKLHSKYYNMFSAEKLLKVKLDTDLKKLKLEKFEFFTQGPNEETHKKGWKLPPKGVVLKTELPMYLEADDDMIKLNLKIAVQTEKVEFLESCVKSLNNRTFALKAAVDYKKFQMGG